MFAELRIGRSNRNRISLPHNDWINRYTNTNLWTQRAWNLILAPEFRTKILELANPVDQYRALELLSKFSNDDPTKVKDNFDPKTDQLVGNLFGDILLHHLRSPDPVRKTFIKSRVLLEISKNSLTIALKKFFKSFNGTPVVMENDMKDYLIRLLLRLGIEIKPDSSDGISPLIPQEIRSELERIKGIMEERQDILNSRLNSKPKPATKSDKNNLPFTP